MTNGSDIDNTQENYLDRKFFMPLLYVLFLYLVICPWSQPKPFDMHQEQSRNTRSRKEDRELIQAIIFFTIIAVFVGILLIKGAL